MSDQEVTDVVGWLSSQRPNVPATGQPAGAKKAGGRHTMSTDDKRR